MTDEELAKEVEEVNESAGFEKNEKPRWQGYDYGLKFILLSR